MLNKGLRDQQNEKINNVLAQLLAIGFIPKGWNDSDKNNVEKQLEKIDLKIQQLIDFNLEQLLIFLKTKSFDWANYESFADFLIGLSNVIEDHRAPLKGKAIGLYNYIQQESKTFSFDIFNKINNAQT